MPAQHPVRYFLLTSILLTGAAGCTATRGSIGNPAHAEASIRAVLDAQVVAWNAGDIEGFMQGYWNAPELRFASGGNVREGWQTTLQSYQAGYPDREAMGTLGFDDLAIRVLSNDAAYVFGRWRLSRGGTYDDASGLFTLIFRQHAEGWRVVHDHTSAAD
ncbi:MAG: DUF4440 domain-containing protein [Bacteroidota bacterium]